MNEVKIFENPQFGQIRTAGTSDEPLFCASDICKALGYTNGRKAVADHVDNPDVTKRDIGVVTGKKADGTDAIQYVSTTFVNESGLYALIFGSKLETAKEFKHWVTSEVLPSIRKSGSYSMANLSRKQLAQMVIEAEEEKERLMLENNEQKKVIEEQKPKVVFADAVAGSESSCLIGELAKIICQNGYQIGQNRLFDWLRDHHFLGSCGQFRNIPMQRYIENGLFEIKKSVCSINGKIMAKPTPYVTGKGQMYFVNLFKSQNPEMLLQFEA